MSPGKWIRSQRRVLGTDWPYQTFQVGVYVQQHALVLLDWSCVASHCLSGFSTVSKEQASPACK